MKTLVVLAVIVAAALVAKFPWKLDDAAAEAVAEEGGAAAEREGKMKCLLGVVGFEDEEKPRKGVEWKKD